MDFPLVYINKGSFGVVMRTILDSEIIVIKQFRIQLLENNKNSYENEIEFTQLAYNMNNHIFIKIIKNEISEINLAKKINKKIPLLNTICINDFGYIYMEWMELSDIYNFLIKDYKTNNFDITGILGCYLNGLYILHNKLNIIHGDLSPRNILVRYVDTDYKQKIIFNDNEYNINTSGYCFKIADFGLSEYYCNNYNHIYRDYLLLFFLYFNKEIFYNYSIFSDIIEITVDKIKNKLYLLYGNTDKYNNFFIEKYNFTSVCYFMDKFMYIEKDDELLYDIPNVLLNEFIEIILSNKN